MRSEKEIQRAHDLLINILQGEAWSPTPQQALTFANAANVLCWALEHDHNPSFGQLLKATAEKYEKTKGFSFDCPGNN